MIKCVICNQEFEKSISFCNHILRKHKLKAQDYYDTYLRKPEDGICKYENCNNSTYFINVETGYKDCCCLEHTNLFRYGVKSNLNIEETKKKAKKNSHTKEAIEKQTKTNLERYGVKAPLQSKEIQEKVKQTCIDKYGVDNPYKSKEIKDKSAKTKLDKYGDSNFNNREKAKQTCLEKYGVTSVAKTNEVKAKIRKTCQERYGADSYLSTNEFREKSKQTCLEKYGTEYITQSEHFKSISRKTCIEHFRVDNAWKSEEIIRKSIQNRINKVTQFELENECTSIATVIDIYGQGWLSIKDQIKLLHLGKNTFVANSELVKIEEYSNTHTRSKTEDELFNFIKSIYDGPILRNSRSIIKPLELDIYLPELKLAIEFNGMYWHSTNHGYDKYSHLNKTELCKLQNIRLIHIFEYEWNTTKDICKSIISSAIGKYNTKIYARQCVLKEVSHVEAKIFLEENHIQGSVPSSYRLGLYYNNELVQLITISKSRYKKDEMELLRMCTKLNTQVIGGFSKLIAHQPYNLVSYVDRSKFSGSGYSKIGFILIDVSGPSYSYYKHNIKLNRVSAQKHKLSALLKDDYNENETEIQNMTRCGWLQVYDCGTLKMQYKKQN